MSNRPHIPTGTFTALAYRDGFICAECGEGSDPDDPWEIDHRTAWRKRKSHDIAGLQLLHRSCNRAKAGR